MCKVIGLVISFVKNKLKNELGKSYRIRFMFNREWMLSKEEKVYFV